MSSLYRDQVTAALNALRVLSSTSYSWFGRRSQPLSPDRRAQLDAQGAAECLTVGLQHQLYADFYTLGGATPVVDSLATPHPGSIDEHTRLLSRANRGTRYWDDGWTIVEFPAPGLVTAAKGGFRLMAEFADVKPVPGAQTIGRTVALRFPNEEIATSPGYYIAAGGGSLAEGGGLFRLYWNICADDAVWLMRYLTAALTSARIAFRFKTLRDPSSYRRADAAVLYSRRADAGAVGSIVGTLYPKLPFGPRLAVPALTRCLAPGLGLAEDPGGAQSFGLNRCRLVAEAAVRAHQSGAVSVRDRLAIVETRFLEESILLDRPYLNAQSPDFPFSFTIRRSRRATPRRTFDRQACLAAAVETGRELCRSACWHRDACNWAGVIPDPNAETEPSATSECSTLGPDLYSGTAGIALFLAQLDTAAPSVQLRRTALGAIRHALLRANAPAPELRLGLYTGWSGIALAAVRVGRLMRHEETLAGARQLTRRLLGRAARGLGRESDLLSGKAGVIVSLLLLWREFGWPEARDLAVRLGRQLLRDARITAAGYSWASVNIPRRRNLTGLSHGAAGVGLALLELTAAVEDVPFRAAGIRAFEYERRHFDPGAGNWSDFRQPGSGTWPTFATAWCNGAPGIGLTRLRAWQILHDGRCREEAAIAFETTRAAVRGALDARDTGFCLCHGVAGNADVLLTATGMLGEAWSGGLIEEAAARAVAPPGTPGLMLGQAGVGYFYLRAADPRAVPTALLVTPGWLGE